MGKHISAVSGVIATGLILEHPALTMSPFSSSGSFINKSRKIILPNILQKEGIRNGKVRIAYPFNFIFFPFYFCLK